MSQVSQKSNKGLLKRQVATVDDDMPQSPGHIMISYNKFSRDVCLKIKERLDVRKCILFYYKNKLRCFLCVEGKI